MWHAYFHDGAKTIFVTNASDRVFRLMQIAHSSEKNLAASDITAVTGRAGKFGVNHRLNINENIMPSHVEGYNLIPTQQ